MLDSKSLTPVRYFFRLLSSVLSTLFCSSSALVVLSLMLVVLSSVFADSSFAFVESSSLRVVLSLDSVLFKSSLTEASCSLV